MSEPGPSVAAGPSETASPPETASRSATPAVCPSGAPAGTADARLPRPPKKAPDLDHLPPVEQVWPGAVHTLPATLPDGRGYEIDAALGGTRYLVHPKNSTDFGIFDVPAGQYGPFANLPGGGWSSGELTVSGDIVAWSMIRPNTAAQIWGGADQHVHGQTGRLGRAVRS